MFRLERGQVDIFGKAGNERENTMRGVEVVAAGRGGYFIFSLDASSFGSQKQVLFISDSIGWPMVVKTFMHSSSLSSWMANM